MGESEGRSSDYLHPVVEEFSRLLKTAFLILLLEEPFLGLLHLCWVDVDEGFRFGKRSQHKSGQPANRLMLACKSGWSVLTVSSPGVPVSYSECAESAIQVFVVQLPLVPWVMINNIFLILEALLSTFIPDVSIRILTASQEVVGLR